MPLLHGIKSKIMAALISKRGHNLLLFAVFLVLSFILWLVLAISEDAIVDMQVAVRIDNVPDSVTLLTNPPASIAVSARLHGSQRIKIGISDRQTIAINYNAFHRRNAIQLSPSDLKNIIRSSIAGAEIISVNPDSISIPTTSSPGVPYPVVIDYRVTPAPQFTIIGQPKPSADTVLVYSLQTLPAEILAVATSQIKLSNLRQPTTVRVPLCPPAGARVFPDSIDVTFDVQSLILKNRKIHVETLNTPAGFKLITFPSQVEVTYMIPANQYSAEQNIRIAVDCADINQASRSLPLKIVNSPASVYNIQLHVDSVEFIIERL